jgi:hypothetical protein
MRKILVSVLGLTLFLAAVPASADVGSSIAIHPHVGTATYKKPFHDIRGRVGIANMTGKTVTVRCTVIATLPSKSGSDQMEGSAIVSVPVMAEQARSPHYEIILRDEHHKFRNSPSDLVAHCNVV